jgi:hypothetical protein
MPIVGLIQKLISAGVVEKQSERLAFTFSFDSYLVWHADRNKTKSGSLEDWGEMLRGYSYALGSLSGEEVSAFIILLQYASEMNAEFDVQK